VSGLRARSLRPGEASRSCNGNKATRGDRLDTASAEPAVGAAAGFDPAVVVAERAVAADWFDLATVDAGISVVAADFVEPVASSAVVGSAPILCSPDV
jgi:hypothetical protein